MASHRLVANSLSEIYFYLMVTCCPVCGRGSLQSQKVGPRGDEAQPMTVVADLRCNGCGRESELSFELPHGLGDDLKREFPMVNPTDEPSTLIDLAQWMTLFRIITEAASKESEKTQARRLGLEAAMCLDEALKFYHDEENAIPHDSAFFHESSRLRFRRNPEHFAKERLLGFRDKLPKTTVMRSSIRSGGRQAKKRWWRWRK